MKSTLTVLFLSLGSVLSVALPGQVKATLTPTSTVAIAGKDISLDLRLETTEATEVSATILSGMDIRATVPGAPPTSIVQAEKGTVKLAPGTVIQRKLTIPAGKLLTGDSKTLQEVSFEWPGLAGAATSLQVAPDPSKFQLADLDMSKTKVLIVTNYGNMEVSFLADKAPKHVENFIKLAKEGFYDGTRFHRVIKGFMLQGGCPNTKKGATGMPGTGNPGYTINAEFNDTKHRRGILSMARSGSPNSAGCQFFVCHADAPHLDGQYTAFGKLEQGYETLDAIANVRVAGPQGSTPVEPVHLHAMVVLPAIKQ